MEKERRITELLEHLVIIESITNEITIGELDQIEEAMMKSELYGGAFNFRWFRANVSGFKSYLKGYLKEVNNG